MYRVERTAALSSLKCNKNKLAKCKFSNVHIVNVGNTFHCYQHRFEFNYSYSEFVSFPMYKFPSILRAKKVVPV
jgi:hypothetical protein